MKVLDRKTEILNVAKNLITEKGYNAVSMRDLAKALDIKAASLYNHIANKQEILSTIILEIAEAFTLGMRQIFNDDSSSIHKLQDLISLHIDISINNSGGMAMMHNDWKHLEADELNRFISLRNAYENNFRTIIKQGIAQSEIINKNPEVIVFSMLSTLQTMYLWYEKRGKMDVNILKTDMVSVLLDGIRT
jgi:AcrR family transcriptional regulator